MKGFTLIEVELSLLTLSMGVLGVVSLYSLGFRESGFAREEMRATAAAEGAMSRIVSTLSDTNLSWRVWQDVASSGDITALPDGASCLADVSPDWASRLTVTADDPARLCVGVRVSPRVGTLDSAPLFYTEVRFQGRTP